MLADGPALRFVHGEPGWTADVERLQERFQRGPCWDCAREQRTVLIHDLHADTRAVDQWPELLDHARRGAEPGVDIRGVASLPLLAQGRTWGVLDLYRTAPSAWTLADLAVANHFAQLAVSHLLVCAERDAWRRAWEQAEHAATHDHLTGLPGRGLLFDRLDHALASGVRRSEAVAVLFIDIDDFKTVNDAFGHAAGDATLVEIAHRLGLTLRANDTLARLSGDEFVIICEDLTTGTGHIDEWLHRLGERILLEVRRPAHPGETSIDVSVSIGAAITSRDASAHTLTARADQAMYAAKNAGGGRLVINSSHRRRRRHTTTDRHVSDEHQDRSD